MKVKELLELLHYKNLDDPVRVKIDEQIKDVEAVLYSINCCNGSAIILETEKEK